jgi:hypothetical protein
MSEAPEPFTVMREAPEPLTVKSEAPLPLVKFDDEAAVER